MCTLTYELAPNSAAAAGKVRRRCQPNFGRRRSVLRRASRIWSAPAGKRTAAKVRGLVHAPLYPPVLTFTIQSGLQPSMRRREGGIRRCHHLVTQSLVGVGAYIM